jgi:hypothetical protein
MCDLYPPVEGLPGVADCDLDTFLRTLKRESNLAIWSGVVAGSVLYALSPLLTVFLPLPSFLLTRGLRDRHAQKISSTGIYILRQSIFLLKMFAALCWGQHPEVRKAFELGPYPQDPGSFRTA